MPDETSIKQVALRQALDSFHMAASISPLTQKVANLRAFYDYARKFLDALDALYDASPMQDEHPLRVEAMAYRCYACARQLNLPTDPSPLLFALRGKNAMDIHDNGTRAVDTIYQLHGDTHAMFPGLAAGIADVSKAAVAMIEKRTGRHSERPVNEAGADAGIKPAHSSDFTTVNWFGTQYTFDDGLQSKAVGLLWVEYEKGGLGLSEKTIGEAIKSAADNYRLASTFRVHPAWGTMIVRQRQGVYALKKPE